MVHGKPFNVDRWIFIPSRTLWRWFTGNGRSAKEPPWYHLGWWAYARRLALREAEFPDRSILDVRVHWWRLDVDSGRRQVKRDCNQATIRIDLNLLSLVRVKFESLPIGSIRVSDRLTSNLKTQSGIAYIHRCLRRRDNTGQQTILSWFKREVRATSSQSFDNVKARPTKVEPTFAAVEFIHTSDSLKAVASRAISITGFAIPLRGLSGSHIFRCVKFRSTFGFSFPHHLRFAAGTSSFCLTHARL